MPWIGCRASTKPGLETKGRAPAFAVRRHPYNCDTCDERRRWLIRRCRIENRCVVRRVQAIRTNSISTRRSIRNDHASLRLGDIRYWDGTEHVRSRHANKAITLLLDVAVQSFENEVITRSLVKVTPSSWQLAT